MDNLFLCVCMYACIHTQDQHRVENKGISDFSLSVHGNHLTNRKLSYILIHSSNGFDQVC